MITEAELEKAIENCSRDPLHIPGAIQGFGALIATDAKFRRIEFASANTETYLGTVSYTHLTLPTTPYV